MGVGGGGPARGGEGEAGEEGLGVGLRGLGFGRCRGGGWGRGQAQHVGPEEVDGALDVGDARGTEALVGRGDELFDGGFVFFEARVDVFFVDEARTLGLGENEVEEEEQADVGVEGNPGVYWLGKHWVGQEGGGEDVPDEEPFGPRLNQQHAG